MVCLQPTYLPLRHIYCISSRHRCPIPPKERFRTRKFTVTAQAYISLSQKGIGACCAGGTRDLGPPSTVEDERVAGDVGYWGTSTGNENGRLLTNARRAGKGKERHGRRRSSRCGSDKVRAEMKAPVLTEQLMQTVKFSQWTVNFSMRSRLRRGLFFAGAPANSR